MANVVVIGGGASGLVAAISAARNNHKVTILERNSVCGKKILVTGNGRCNYYNSDQSIEHYHSNTSTLVKIINENNLKRVLSFFDSIGVIPKIKNGYYYPNSNQASSIRDALLMEALSLGIDIKYNTYVDNIEKSNNTFIVKTNNEFYSFDKVIISTGSCAYSKTGSDGNGYKLLEGMGHNIIKPLPALVQLIGEGNYFKEWSGIRSDVSIKLYEDNKFIKEEKGEIQLTDYGVSGICVMQLSRYVSLGLNNKKSEKILINFIPWIRDNNAFIEFVEERSKRLINRDIYGLLEGIINSKLINVILNKSKIKSKEWSQLSSEEKERLANLIISFSVIIKNTKSFDNAQVCLGGVSMEEVSNTTFESREISGLYITGELLDVDGDCGGYNLTFAWISGILSGCDISD